MFGNLIHIDCIFDLGMAIIFLNHLPILGHQNLKMKNTYD